MNELLLMCLIAGRRAAIPAIRVQSVIEIDDITPIPGVPSFIRGLTALRSQALTVIDCPVALGFTGRQDTSGQVPGGFGEGWQAAARGMVETDGGPTLLIDVEALVSGPIAQAA